MELSDYRPADKPAKLKMQPVAFDVVVEEKTVEEMQGIEAVNRNQPIAPPGAAPPPAAEAPPRAADVSPRAVETMSEAVERSTPDPTVEPDQASSESTDEATPPIEAKESEPSDDGEGSEPDDGDSGGDEGGSPKASDEDGDGDEDDSVEGDRLDAILESLLLAAGAPLPVRRICDALRSGPKAKEVRAALQRLQKHYSGDCGIHLVEVSGGYQFRTAPANGDYVRALLREKPARLGRAALETLSIVAYKQPATRADVEAIRGVDADSAINTLLAKKLIKIDGRKEAVGRPLLYSTTPEFLEVFGLKDLKELPTLKEIGPVPEPEDEYDIEETGIEEGEAAAAIVDAAGQGQSHAQGEGEGQGETVLGTEEGAEPELAGAQSEEGAEPELAGAQSEEGAEPELAGAQSEEDGEPELAGAQSDEDGEPEVVTGRSEEENGDLGLATAGSEEGAEPELAGAEQDEDGDGDLGNATARSDDAWRAEAPTVEGEGEPADPEVAAGGDSEEEGSV